MKTNKEKALNLKEFEHKWIALSVDRKRVISSGDTLEEVMSKIDEKIREKAAYTKVLPLETPYIPGFYEI